MYAAVVKRVEPEEMRVDVEFLKKTGTKDFVMPEKPEVDTVDLNDIVNILPKPDTILGTARCSAKLKFGIDMSHVSV